MLALLRHLLDPRYLYAQNEEPLGRWPLHLGLWGLSLLLGACIAWRWRVLKHQTGQPALAAEVSLGACLAGLVALVLHVEVAGAFSARIWPLSATGVALVAPLLGWLAPRAWTALGAWGRALAAQLSPEDAPLPWGWGIAVLGVHLLALSWLSASLGQGWWPAGVALACLVAASWGQAGAHRQGGWRALRPEVLAPLALPTIAALARRGISDWLGVNVDAYQAFPFPNLWAPWFDTQAMLLAGLGWMLVTTGAFLWRCTRGRRAWVATCIGLAPLALGLGWYAVLLCSRLSQGATGSDPYCYLQMAIDLASRGTPLHDFPLAELARENALSLWPTVHVGYHLPLAGNLAPTVWPIGWPVLMAPLYWIGGERGLLWAAPLYAAFSAMLTALLAQQIGLGRWRAGRWLAGGVAAFIVLTSDEGATRSLVPMADAATQALTVLMLLALARARLKDRVVWSAIAGGVFALAYWVRHPQVLLGLAALPVYLSAPWPWSRRVRHALLFAVAAAALALPDLLYHWAVFGAPWHTESPEWFLLSWRNVGAMALDIVCKGLPGRGEFGYLLPLIVYGAWRQARSRVERPWAAMMWAGFIGVLGFNLFYSALRLRDLISIFPLLGLWAAHGIVELWPHGATHDPGHMARRALALTLILVSLSARTTWMLGMPWFPQVRVFGHVTPLERADYALLAEALPPGAVVGTGVNSGAVEHYTGHATVRPSSWSNAELASFVTALERLGRPFFVLDDGEEMRNLLSRIRTPFALRRVGDFTLPTFEGVSQYAERRAVLYALENTARPSSSTSGLQPP